MTHEPPFPPAADTLVVCELPARLEEIVAPLAFALSPQGYVTEDAATAQVRPPRGHVRLRLFPAPDSVSEAVAALKAFLVDQGARGSVRVEEVPRAEWAEQWKVDYHAFKLGRRVWIRPSWEAPPEGAVGAGDVVIAIDPGLAFGTGTHETTRLCVEATESELDARLAGGTRPSVLDVGTGSAILAILAARLGAARVTGTEIDLDALEAARVNARDNGVADRVTLGDEADPAAVGGGPFDLVIANILSSILVGMAPGLAGCVASGGTLLLSGILEHEAPRVSDAFERLGMHRRTLRTNGEWALVVLDRPA